MLGVGSNCSHMVGVCIGVRPTWGSTNNSLSCHENTCIFPLLIRCRPVRLYTVILYCNSKGYFHLRDIYILFGKLRPLKPAVVLELIHFLVVHALIPTGSSTCCVLNMSNLVQFQQLQDAHPNPLYGSMPMETMGDSVAHISHVCP